MATVYIYRVNFEWPDQKTFEEHGNRTWRTRYLTRPGALRQATLLKDRGAVIKSIDRSLPVQWPQDGLPL